MQTTKLLKCVSVFDQAIDRERTTREDVEKYVQTRDLSLLKFKPDLSPAYFHIRRIPVHTFSRVVEPVEGRAEARMLAFMVGVERIEGLRTPDGQLTQPRAPGLKVESATGPVYWWTEAELEQLIDDELLDKPTVDEIGKVALDRAGLRRRNADSYRLPGSLGDEWADLVSRHAVTPSPKSCPPSSEKPADETPPTPF